MMSKFSTIKAISFDLDDTLYDNKVVIKKAFKTLYHHLLISYPEVKDHFDYEDFLAMSSHIQKIHPHEVNLR